MLASLGKIDSPLSQLEKEENIDLTWNKVVRFYVILLELFASHEHTMYILNYLFCKTFCVFCGYSQNIILGFSNGLL